MIAPALIPRKPGERIKTNPRDARKLVELGRAGLLTVVRPPTTAEEGAAGTLCRQRSGLHSRGRIPKARGIVNAATITEHQVKLPTLEVSLPASTDTLTLLQYGSARRTTALFS